MPSAISNAAEALADGKDFATASTVSPSHEATSEAQRQESARVDQDDGFLQAVLECASHRHPQVHFLDCPEIERALANEPRVDAILQEVARHYDVPQAIVTWRDAGRLCLKAHSGEGVLRTAQIPGSTVFNHTIARELPIIIADTDLECQSPSTRSALALAPGVERPRFYAASPLVLGKRAYVGTLCIADCSRARPDFLLKDAEFLVKKAREMGAVLEGWAPEAARDASGAQTSDSLQPLE